MNSISQNLDFFKGMTGEEILNHRKNKFLQIGRNKGFVSNPESLSAVQNVSFNFQEIIKSKMNIVIAVGASIALLTVVFFFL